MQAHERITEALEKGAAGGGALVPFMTAGYPEPDTFIETLQAVAAHADVVEIGVPFSDPMADGVGPARWAPRLDEPELDGHGHPKITPMAGHDAFFVSAGRDPRGLPVLSRDDQVIGHVTEMWIDAAEHMVRYVEYELASEWGQGKRLVPITMARIQEKWVKVRSLNAAHFDGVPKIAGTGKITKLEEDKVCAYYAGGTLYS